MPRRPAIFAPVSLAPSSALANPDYWGDPRYDGACSVNEAAKLLGVSRAMIYRLKDRGEIVPVIIGEHMKFSRRQLREYLARKAK